MLSSVANGCRIAGQKANNEIQSRPVDPDQIAARLLEIANKDTLPQAVSQPSYYDRSPTPPPPAPPRLKEKNEIEDYNNLVKDGCPPPYPINLLDQVSQNPEKYRKMLRP